MKYKIAVFSGLILCLYLWLVYDRRSVIVGLLPQQIEVSKIVSTHIVSGIRESCGATVYLLSDGAIANIKEKQLRFFKGLTKAKNFESDPKNPYYSYEEWQETPIKKKPGNRGFYSGMSCAVDSGLDEKLSEQIYNAIEKKGSYYTGHYEGQLVVIPALRIAIFAHS